MARRLDVIVPALAVRAMKRWQTAAGYALGALAYLGGLAVSVLADLPAGPVIVCTLAGLAAAGLLAGGSGRDVTSRTAGQP